MLSLLAVRGVWKFVFGWAYLLVCKKDMRPWGLGSSARCRPANLRPLVGGAVCPLAVLGVASPYLPACARVLVVLALLKVAIEFFADQLKTRLLLFADLWLQEPVHCRCWLGVY